MKTDTPKLLLHAYDGMVALFQLALSLTLLELNLNGFVSSVLDINVVYSSLLVVTAVVLWWQPINYRLTGVRKYYAIVLGVFNAWLLYRYISLLFPDSLLGLSVTIILTSAVIYSVLTLYDLRSKN